jgi:hypothetical protein
MNEQQHEMVLEKSGPSGAEEWYCPTCGRRMLINWEPKFKKTVLETGDESVSHSGAKGSLHIGTTQKALDKNRVSEEEPNLSIDDKSLEPWKAWLDTIDFENLWNSDS